MASHSPIPNHKYRSWNIDRLKDEEVMMRYRKHFIENFEPTFVSWCNRPCSSQDDIDSTYKVITGVVERTARETIGSSDRTKWRIPLIHPHLPGIREMCKHLRKACQLGGVGADTAFKELKRRREEATALAKESIEANWRRFVERTDSLESTELMKLAKSFKSARSQCRSTQLERSE